MNKTCNCGADRGPDPLIVNLDEAARQNSNYRTALWTGTHLQLTLMSIPAGGDIGLEMHPYLDQFIRVEDGTGRVEMGAQRDKPDVTGTVDSDWAFIIPAGIWHNLTNTGSGALKLYSVYAPPQHPAGTVHETKEDAEADENH